MDAVEDLLEPLRGISLGTLEERAALLRRVDTKYVIDRDLLRQVIDRLGDDHDVLEIGGERVFGYENVYFDTSQLRCFREHVESVKPRFKARTRHYVNTGQCVFEVKLKPIGGGTDKRQTDHPADAADALTSEAESLLENALRETAITPPDALEPVLRTSFRRLTLAAREGDARLTADLDVRLTRMDDRSVRLRDDLILLETKSEDGHSPADQVLAALEAEVASLSKYRAGVDALLQRDESGELDPARRLFG